VPPVNPDEEKDGEVEARVKAGATAPEWAGEIPDVNAIKAPSVEPQPKSAESDSGHPLKVNRLL
jgi:hypothetical protein